MTTKIILIRHGQTDGNAKKQYCGMLDLGLNQNGRLQVEKLGCRLKKDSIQMIYSSDRKRALESARIIFKGRRINKIAGLREINFGIFEGKNHQEIRETNADIYDRWLIDPYNTAVPESENLPDFQERVTRALEKIILANANKTVAIVCHGGTISIVLSRINGSKNFWELIPGSASLNIIEYVNSKAKITLFNDISHLNGDL